MKLNLNVFALRFEVVKELYHGRSFLPQKVFRSSIKLRSYIPVRKFQLKRRLLQFKLKQNGARLWLSIWLRHFKIKTSLHKDL